MISGEVAYHFAFRFLVLLEHIFSNEGGYFNSEPERNSVRSPPGTE